MEIPTKLVMNTRTMRNGVLKALAIDTHGAYHDRVLVVETAKEYMMGLIARQSTVFRNRMYAAFSGGGLTGNATNTLGTSGVRPEHDDIPTP
jgi:hypothetical protein